MSTAEFLDCFAESTKEIFQTKERFYQLLEEAKKAIAITETVESLLQRNPYELITIQEAAEVFQEAPETIRDLIEKNQKLLCLDDAHEEQITIRTLFHAATLFPQNPIAQIFVRKLLDSALN